MTRENNFTEGPILSKLIRFALPVLMAMFLQGLYGAVDLAIVGNFAEPLDVSAVSTGSQILLAITTVINSFAMGVTVFLGQQIGMGERKKAGRIIGAGIFFFLILGAVLTLLFLLFSEPLAVLMKAPEEAFDQTVAYLRICGGGTLVIIAYTLIGSIFRGIGDSRTPLYAVIIACICNIAGDLILVAGFGMGAAGAAIATVFAQVISVIVSLVFIRRQEQSFSFHLSDIRFDKPYIGHIVSLGLPLAISDLLVNISFLVIMAIVNNLGVTASAGVGVAEKVCSFIMLVPSAFMQSMAAFVAQNNGAGKFNRSVRALLCGIGLSFACGVVMFYLSFFHGDVLARIFSNDASVIAAATDYLKAYGIDCLMTPIFFVFIGFFNGIGMTKFVMAQGMISAFCVRIPVSYLMSRQTPVSLFHIGLATPASSLLQTVMCLICFRLVYHRYKEGKHSVM